MKKILAVSAVSASMILTGCATTGSTTNGDTAKKAGIGALAGAVLGAGVSKATGGEHTKRDAAIGAGVGALIGVGVDQYMKKQEEKLKAQTAGTGIEVTRDPATNNINLAIPEAITFNVGKYDIKPSSYTSLNQVASTLKEYNQTNVVVNGYASIEGNPNANQILSQNRAAAVANYLANQGVATSRISAIGRGATTQFGSTYEPNRRVELTIIAPQSVN